jgi:nitroreductase
VCSSDLFVVDYSRVKTGRTEDSRMYAAMDAAFVSENVYLYFASEGLATVVLGSVDRPALAKAMGLKESQEIMLAQTVGYPKK